MTQQATLAGDVISPSEVQATRDPTSKPSRRNKRI